MISIFRSREPIFGLDIGHETLKVAQVVSAGNKAEIVSLSEMPIPKGAKTAQGIKEKDIIAQKIREARERAQPHKIATAACVSALPESLVFTKVIELPQMSDKEIAQAMPFQIAHAFPISAEEAYFDWAILGASTPKDTLEVLAVAAPKILVDDFIEVVEKSNSELVALETKPTALTRLFARKASSMIIVDIGAVVTGIDIVNVGDLRLTATVEAGAEQIKTNMGAVKEIADEVKNLVKYYVGRLGEKAEFSSVTLCGGGANLKAIPEELTKLLKIPAVIGKPALNIAGYNPTLATVLGLALRGE
jgi:type IV pilus assembly protein PilM